MKHNRQPGYLTIIRKSGIRHADDLGEIFFTGHNKYEAQLVTPEIPLLSEAYKLALKKFCNNPKGEIRSSEIMCVKVAGQMYDVWDLFCAIQGAGSITDEHAEKLAELYLAILNKGIEFGLWISRVSNIG